MKLFVEPGGLPPMTNNAPARLPRRWWKVLTALLVLTLGFLAVLPWLLTTAPARSRVAAGINRALAPGRVEFDELHLSWFGPTRLSSVTLFDPKGTSVVKAPSAVYDQSLFRMLFEGRQPSILSLDGAALEVERSAEGVIDLADALRTIIANPDPKRDITIRIGHGSLRYRDPFLAEPVTADSADLNLRIPTAPNPVTWSLKLGQGNASLEVQGDFDRWLSKGGAPGSPELQVGVVGKRWPLVARTAGIDATGRLDGSLDFTRKRGRWVLSGDARVTGLNARGKTLSGDTLILDQLEAGWDLSEGEDGWTIRRLSLSSPLGEIKAEGQLNGPNGTGKQRIDGRLDLVEVARQLPHALRLRKGLTVERGSARVTVDLTSSPAQSTYEIEAKLSDLAARDQDRTLSLKDPATLTARVVSQRENTSVERLSVKTSFLDVSAKGRLEDGVDLEGTIDLGGFRKQLGEWVELSQVDLSGRAEVSGSYRFKPSADAKVIAAKSSPTGVQETGSKLSLRDAEPRFENKLTANLRDLRVEGLGLPAIRRDSATLEIALNGLAGASGWPERWESLEITARSGESSLQAGLTIADPGASESGSGNVIGDGHQVEPRVADRSGPFNLTVSGASVIAVGNRKRGLSGRLTGVWSVDERRVAFDRAMIALAPSDRGKPGDRLAMIAKGRLDLKAGVLSLERHPETLPGTLIIDPDGLRLAGLGQGLEAIRFDGGLSGNIEGFDALLADLTGRTPLGLSGRWAAIARARGDAEGVQVAGKVGLVDPSDGGSKPVRPTSMAVRAHYSPTADRVDLSEFTVSTAYGTLDASGKLEEPLGSRKVDLSGKLAPDFGAITALLVDRVEPGARIDGKPSSFRASGTLGESLGGWKGLDADLGFDLTGADIYGMKFGPSPVTLRAKAGKLGFDPISTSLNEGHIRLEPELDLDAPGGPMLRLGKNSTIREARINDEVSRRVLAFVAPVLDQATRASGLVSVDLDHAEFPIGPGRGRQTKVEGAVVFQDVEFAPGPLAAELLGAIGRRDLSLKLDQPVTLTIADGRVNQRGMAIPIADFTRIELAGWVDFDRNIALTATVSVTPAMLGNNPLLSDIAAGTKVQLPIAGTLDKPKIDREAFRSNLQDLGKTLLTRGATRGAMELLMRLARPRDPDAPPPPPRMTPEERRALRQEKKAVRRGEIPPPPRENP